MQQAWLKGLSGPERDQMINLVRNNKILLDKLIEIWYNRVREVEDVNLVDYDNPSWAYEQAHRNGYKEALRWMIKMATVDNEQNNKQ